MYYSAFCIVAFVHHIILNYDVLRNGGKDQSSQPTRRYRQFLLVLLIFYLLDLLWGFSESSGIFIVFYINTMLFFATMALSVLLWTRYVASYLDRHGMKSKLFLAGGWLIFAFVIVNLIVNIFYPTIYSFTDDGKYVPMVGRYIFMGGQILMFFAISIYSLIVSLMSKGRDRVHYMAVGLSGGVMAVLTVIQTTDAFYPYYTIGCLIANTLIHVFVEEDEKSEQKRITAKAKKANITFTQIAESLASNYDVIYYIDLESGEYTGFTAHNIYGELEINETGADFFGEAQKNTMLVVYPNDRERVSGILNKDFLISALEGRKQYETRYRLMVAGKIKHTSFSVRKSTDGNHLIIGVENIDDEVRKEKEHLRALNTEKELARRDELTGTKNKTAFTELEQSIQDGLDEGTEKMLFAIVVCDLNDLKKVNDTEGHVAGDEYIKKAARILCDIFSHSPVFRIGGDEFAVYLKGADYAERDQLLKKLHDAVLKNKEEHSGPVIAAGMAEYDPSRDNDINEIFERADQEMYEDKRELKGERG